MDKKDMPQSDIIMIGPMRFNAQQHEVSRDGKTTRLTSGESWLLRFLVDHANTAYTLSQLSLEIYGTDNADTMIKVAIRNLRQKIEPDLINPTYILTVPGEGYTLVIHDTRNSL